MARDWKAECYRLAPSSRADVLDANGEMPCANCGGSGYATYGSTATWRGGIGGQALTCDVCDRCWGSGCAERPWPSHRWVEAMHERIDAGAAGGGEWTDGDDPKVREAFGFQLRDHVSYQGGEHSLAPTLVFADCDYEVGDGSCGLYEDGKSANEPAIVYVRADAFIALRDAFARLCDDAEGWMQKDEWGTWPYMEGEGVYSDKSDFEISLRVAREMLARVGSERNKSET